MKKLIPYIVVLVLGFVIGFFIKPYDIPESSVVSTSDTIWIDTSKIVIDTVLQPYLVVKRDTFYKDIDTLAILEDYYMERYYTIDTNINDVSVSVNQSVFQNKLNSFVLEVQNNRETIVNTNITNKYVINTKGLYVGTGVTSFDGKLDVLFKAGYNDGNIMYESSYGLINKSISFGVLFKIRKR